MVRPRDPQRTADLLAAAADSVQRTGIAGTTLRPLAAELGVAPRTLLYHFGSKEGLLVEVVRALRRRQPTIAELLDDPARGAGDPVQRLVEAVAALWREAKGEEARPFLALYFELASSAIRDPERYRPLLLEVDREWGEAISAHLLGCGAAAEEARAIADALLIGYRGALGFALATGRWDAADASILALAADLRRRASAAIGGSAEEGRAG